MIAGQINSCNTCQIDMTRPVEDGAKSEGIVTVYRCVSCDRRFPRKDGILDLLNDDSDTALDVDQYIKGQQEAAGKWIYEYMFSPFFETLAPARRFGFSLEIGAGPGAFTRAVRASGVFDKIVASDISIGFLRYQKSMMGALDYDLVRLDANRLPFSGSQFDVVFGNSVLHHFIDYKTTLEECFRVLKPGGIAVFGEPLLGGLLPAYLLANVICGVVDMDPSADEFLRSGCSRLRKRALNAIELIESKKNRDKLLRLEDKFVFSNSEMRRLSEEVGFRNFATLGQVCPNSPLLRQPIKYTFSKLIPEVESSFRENLLLKYDWLFDSFERYLITPNVGEVDSPSFATFGFYK